MFKLETHCHTSEVSGCSRLPAVQLVTQLKRSGYGGAVITDHFHHGYFDSLTGSWTQKIDCFLSGYRAACEAGAQAGLHIYCGLEFRTTTSDNDYLLFGAAPELLYSTPELHRYTIPQLRALADREGLLLVQAHPFRTGLTREDPALLDGVEVFNGNARHDSHNDDALRFARENDIFDLVYHATKLALAQPGTGERLFTFDEPKNEKNNEKSNNSINNDILAENSVKKNNFTGLSAIILGQAEPGTLEHHHETAPATPAAASTPTMARCTSRMSRPATYTCSASSSAAATCIPSPLPKERAEPTPIYPYVPEALPKTKRIVTAPKSARATSVPPMTLSNFRARFPMT